MVDQSSREAPGARSLSLLLEQSIAARESLFDAGHQRALRLFNGFAEGCPQLVIDVYGSTVLINNYADDMDEGSRLVREAIGAVRSQLPWLRAGIVKARRSPSTEDRHGTLVFGEGADNSILEDGIWYAIDLTLGRDSSFYIDTRHVREWAHRSLTGKTVLNAFAHTGSLGVAATAGGAARVVHLDRTPRFLNLAKQSYRLNGLVVEEEDFVAGDFFRVGARFRRQNRRFDCVFIDPPFFAAGSAGTVDQIHESARLINKARPLVEDGGYLVAINNALYVSGAEYLTTLQQLGEDGYLRLEEIIPVPQDCLGFGTLPGESAVVDPAPFNHSTKIVVLRVRRK